MRHLALACCLSAASLVAQSVIVPAANATTRSPSGLNTAIRNAANPRTYQQGIAAAELAGVPIGSYITGISLRFYVATTQPASWPTADITYTNYDIHIGPAAPLATWVADFAMNFASPPQHVRTGPMIIDAGTFTNTNPPGVTPNPWSEFYFDFQVPYLYLGGDLAIMLSHPGSSDPAVAPYPEVVTANAATHGVARSQSVHPPGTASAVTTFYVMRVHYGTGLGCPGTNNRVPVLVCNGNTTGGAGGNIRLQVANIQPNAPVVFVIGFVSAPIPFPNGCTLLVVPAIDMLVMGNANGRAQLNVTIPPAVLGSAYVQCGVLDIGAPGGFSGTNMVNPAAQ